MKPLEGRHELPNGPPVTFVQRGARAYLEELYSLKHRRDTVKKMSGEGSAAFKECERQFVEFRDVTIPSLFHDGASTVLGRHVRDWRIAGERWRGPTALRNVTKDGGKTIRQAGPTTLCPRTRIQPSTHTASLTSNPLPQASVAPAVTGLLKPSDPC